MNDWFVAIVYLTKRQIYLKRGTIGAKWVLRVWYGKVEVNFITMIHGVILSGLRIGTSFCLKTLFWWMSFTGGILFLVRNSTHLSYIRIVFPDNPNSSAYKRKRRLYWEQIILFGMLDYTFSEQTFWKKTLLGKIIFIRVNIYYKI